MTFKKAAPQQARLKVALYGPPGSGKTFTALLVAEGLAKREAKRIAFVDTERGTDFYAMDVKQRATHPEAFDIDTIYTRSLAEVLENVRALDPAKHGVVVIDSITHLWDAAIAAYEGKLTGAQTIPMQAWGKIKKPYKDLVRYLMESPMHVFILGRQKNVFETGADGQMAKVGVGMRAEGETEYEPHICLRMEAKKSAKDTTMTTYYALFEKDRTGVLSGRTVANPSFATFEPILPLLGGTQAMGEDPDETAARDGDLLDESRAREAKKEDRSSALLSEASTKINTATSLEALGEAAALIGKNKRHMTEPHLESARALYANKHKTLSANLAPTEA